MVFQILGLGVMLLTMTVTTTPQIFSPCGPEFECTCTKTSNSLTNKTRAIKMVCSDKRVTLRQVCETIKLNDSVAELQIDSQDIPIVRKEDIVDCKHIFRLTMRNCGIRNISNLAFRDFKSLTKLDISMNNMSGMYEGWKPTFLDPIKSLTEINLRLLKATISDEESDRMTYPNLRALKNIETIHIDGLPNRQFPRYFGNMKNLRNLYLSGYPDKYCNMKNLKNDTFQNVPSVENLFMSKCRVLSVEAGTFKAMPMLKRLDISLNRQLGFDPVLNISFGLQFTSVDFLNYSQNYNTFSVGHRISKEDICYFKNTTLRELAIDGMKLELIETNALLLMPESLEIFHLNDNQFTFGLYLLQLACLVNLKTLEANYQNFFHKPIEYTKENHTSDMQCRQLPKTSCPYLDENILFNISRQRQHCPYFNETPASLTSMPFPKGLKRISFKDCDLKYKVDKLPIIPIDNEINSLDFSGNIAHELVGPVGPLTALTFLNLSRNYCSYIGPQFFTYTMNLQQLDLQKNFLGNLLSKAQSKEIFKPLKKLQSIDLSHNQIKDISSTIFTYLVNLEILDLSFNSLDKWNIDISANRNISLILLQSNSVETLPLLLTDELTELSLQHNISIDLTNNPIRFSCRYKEFLKWMAKHQSLLLGLENYTFIDDNGHALTTEMFLSKINTIDAICRSTIPKVVLISVGVSVIITIVISVTIYAKRWTLRYYWYILRKRRRSEGSSEQRLLLEYRFDVFVSFHGDNSKMNDISDDLKEGLEKRGIKNFLSSEIQPGHNEIRCIHEAVEKSKDIVIVLCEKYFKDEICSYTYNIAHAECVWGRKDNINLILMERTHLPFDDFPKSVIYQILQNKKCIESRIQEKSDIEQILVEFERFKN